MSVTTTFTSTISTPANWTYDLGSKLYTYDGTAYKYYLNGVLTTSQGTVIVAFPTTSIVISSGKLPEYILLQSTAIDATEALYRYRTGRIRNGASQLLYLDMSKFDRTTNIVPDISGNGNNGILTGGTIRRLSI